MTRSLIDKIDARDKQLKKNRVEYEGRTAKYKVAAVLLGAILVITAAGDYTGLATLAIKARQPGNFLGVFISIIVLFYGLHLTIEQGRKTK